MKGLAMACEIRLDGPGRGGAGDRGTWRARSRSWDRELLSPGMLAYPVCTAPDDLAQARMVIVR